MGRADLIRKTFLALMLGFFLQPCVSFASIETIGKQLNSITLSQNLVRDESSPPLVFRVIVREKKPSQTLEQFLNVLWLGPIDAANAKKSLHRYQVGEIIGGNKVLARTKENGMDCLKLSELERGYEFNQCWRIGTKAALVLSSTSGFPDLKLKNQVSKTLNTEKIQ